MLRISVLAHTPLFGWAIIGWGRLARQVRGKVLQLRQMEYVVGARALGASAARVIGKYIVPNASSHIIFMATLYVPEYLLVESSLSFLGIGLTPPLTSWGVLLSDAQKVRVVLQYPWLLIPGLFIAALRQQRVGDTDPGPSRLHRCAHGERVHSMPGVLAGARVVPYRQDSVGPRHP